MAGPLLAWHESATADNPAMARPRDQGAVTEVQAAHAWVTARRAELEAALT